MADSIKDIEVNDHIFDIDFHPKKNIISAGLINGSIQMFTYDDIDNKENKIIKNLNYHKEACRCVLFSINGESSYSASKDLSIRKYDLNQTGIEWAKLDAHTAPVNTMINISSDILATGDDIGCIKLWDTRQHQSVAIWKEHTDYISDMTINNVKRSLLATSGDGRLSVYDLRKNKRMVISDELDDELLSVKVIKNGNKVICGSQIGALIIFDWGRFGDMSSRFLGHPNSVETLLKIDEDTVFTGSSDGFIRVVQIHPNKLLGLIGDHEEFPVEILKVSHDNKYIGSISYDNKIHFSNVQYLYENDENDNDNDNDTHYENHNEIENIKTNYNHISESMHDSNQEDSESSEYETDHDMYEMDDYINNKNTKEKIILSKNEEFFSDL